MFIGTSVGMVSATMRPPASAARAEASSWRAVLSGVRESTVSRFQLRGRRAVVVMATIRSISSSVKVSRQPLVMYSRVVPGWSRTTSQKASISRRSACAGRDRVAVPVRVGPGLGRREPEAAGLDRLGQEPGHGGDLLVVGHLRAPLVTHHPAPQGTVPDQEAGVDPEVALQLAEVVAEAGPVPGEAVLERHQRHPLDLGHHPADVVVVLGLDRGQGEAAVAPDDRGHPVQVGGGGGRVPEQLGVVVGVGVDDAGGDHQALGIELGGAGLVHPTRRPR